MAVSSPKYGITRGKKGWQKTIHGQTRWVASFAVAPTGRDADKVFEQRLGLPDDDPRKIRLDAPPAAAERPEHISLEQISNAFLTRKLRRVEAGRLHRDTYDEYVEAIQDFVDHAGADTRFCDLAAHHFAGWADALSARFGLDRFKKFIIVVRMMFRWAGPGEKGVSLVPSIPTYGDGFKLPSRSEFRRAGNLAVQQHGPKRYTPAQVREQLEGKEVLIPRKRTMLVKGKPRVVSVAIRRHRRPSKALKAMILLAVNGGFGNRDCAFIPTTIVRPGLDDGWIDYARDKTGIKRLFWLWPETRKALEEWWAVRQRMRPAKGSVELWGVERPYADLFFLTQEGRPFVEGKKDQIGMRYAALLKALGQTSKGFRSLRRTCRTVLAETGQELAIDLIMGHGDDAADMAKVYTVEVSREIIKRVCQHGRLRLLFGDHQPMLFSQDDRTG